MDRIGQLRNVVQRRGAGYFAYLLTGVFVPWIAYHCWHAIPTTRRKQLQRVGFAVAGLGILGLVKWSKDRWTTLGWVAGFIVLALIAKLLARQIKLSRIRRCARELTRDRQALCVQDEFTSWDDILLESSTREAVEAVRRVNPTQEVVIGRIDGDGRVLGLYGPLPGLPNVKPADFAERPRFSLDIVLLENHVLVRKDYRGDQASFLNEWLNLVRLSGKANVPALHHVDEKGCQLYKNLVLGKTIREILVDAGAKILHAHTQNDPELNRLEPAQRIEAVWARGKEHVQKCFPEIFFEEFESQLDKIHAAGVAGLSLTYGNVIVDYRRGAPWFIDFEGARAYDSTRSIVFNHDRDKDRDKFNRCYGRNLVTEKSARAALAAMSNKLGHWYAPIDFGQGLVTRGFWSTDSGTGRWEFLNGPVLDSLLTGQRVLDLGSNNGVMPMMMLRAGARKVVGLELSPDLAACGRLTHRLFEWRDMRRYGLQIHECDMREVLRTDWGKFDVVTAYCSLYYLSPEDMARVVRKSAELAPVMVVQAKSDTRSEATENKSEKSSLSFLKRLLEENGFPRVEVITPKGFSRPLLIGRVSAPKPPAEKKVQPHTNKMVAA